MNNAHLTPEQQVRDLALEITNPAGVDRWMDTPLPLLDGATPAQKCEAGEHEDVLALLTAIMDGAYL